MYGVRTTRKISSISKLSNTRNEINPPLSEEDIKVGTRLGSDSHADMSCVNKHAYVEAFVEGMTVDAFPFDENIGHLKDLPIVHAIYAVDNIMSYATTLIRINHAVYIKDMQNALLCPNQARSHGIVVDDVPLHLDHTGRSTFALHVEGTMLPFELFGPTAFL